jgi:hypothetical protein
VIAPKVTPPAPAPPPQPAPVLQPAPLAVGVPPVVVPPLAPPITPVPPGGATVPAQSTAKREEKARKQASQSAYVIRPAGTPGDEWFYGAVGVMGVLAMLLIANGLRPGPKPKLALARAYVTDDQRRRRGRTP